MLEIPLTHGVFHPQVVHSIRNCFLTRPSRTPAPEPVDPNRPLLEMTVVRGALEDVVTTNPLASVKKLVLVLM